VYYLAWDASTLSNEREFVGLGTLNPEALAAGAAVMRLPASSSQGA